MDGTLRKYLYEKLITGEEAFMFAQDKAFSEILPPGGKAGTGRACGEDKSDSKPAANKK